MEKRSSKPASKGNTDGSECCPENKAAEYNSERVGVGDKLNWEVREGC